MKYFLLLFCCFLTFLESVAQAPNIKFDRISLEQGLSQSTVNNIVQDYQGFIWFATLDGLNKFDGYKMTVYSNNPADKTALKENVINALHVSKYNGKETLWVGTSGQGFAKYNRINDNFENFEHDSKNNESLPNNSINAIKGNGKYIWIATDFGLGKFDVETFKFKNYFFHSNKKDSTNINSITTICIDNNKNIWVGTKGGLVLIQENGEIKYLSVSKTDSEAEISSLFMDDKYILWVGTPRGLFALDAKTKLAEQIAINGKKNFYAITSIIKDSDDILWFGTENYGLCRYTQNNEQTYFYDYDPTNSESISTNGIKTLYADQTNILWVGTSLGGVNKWNRAADDLAVFRHNPYDEHSLSANQVRTIYKDKNDEIWIGTVEGGLNKWDIATNQFTHFSFNKDNDKSLSSNHVRSILEDNKDNFWVATDGGGLNKFDKKKQTFKHYKHEKNNPKSISNNRAWKIFQDETGNLWVGTFGGGINLYNYKTDDFQTFKYISKENLIETNQVTSIIKDKKNTLWVGTFGGLLHFNTKTHIFKRYSINSDKNSLSNNRVYSLIKDKEGILWVGTKGGLNKYNEKSDNFTRYTTFNTENMPNNVITGILEDKSGNLWFSTNKGIARFNKTTQIIRSFDVRDGLQSNEFLAGSAFKAPNGEMFFGGINGFNAFFPDKIKDNPNQPSLVITGFFISNLKTKLDSSITEKKQILLKYFQNDISLEFVALDFIFPEKNKYKYKLEGYDKDWVNAKYRKFASYTNLSPGKYIFMVKGSNNDEVWSEQARKLVIIISPAWWQTITFKVLSVVFVMLLIFVLYQIRLKRIKAYNKHLEQEVRTQTAEIRQQNEEIITQNEEIILQKDEILRQNVEITDSIKYAKRIQTAALPANKFLLEKLPEHFILFKPKDIVSGDFYWAGKQGNKIIITAADCTGHGVPGAFMSMLGISFLNEIINSEKVTSPSKILNLLRGNIVNALKQKTGIMHSKDGMDIALTVIDTEKNTICFAGAYNPLFLVRASKLQVIPANKMPVAIYDNMADFSDIEVKYEAGDAIYMFSDGYADQFGGPKGKKFMSKRFKILLTENAEKPMQQQKEILDTSICNWMQEGKEEQIDDIVVIGIRL